MSLYKEALALADENSIDFRLDPLLNLHIHHNLAEIIPLTSEFLEHCLLAGSNPSDNNEVKKRKAPYMDKFGKYYVKRGKTNMDCKPVFTWQDSSLEQHNTHDDGALLIPGSTEKSVKTLEVNTFSHFSSVDSKKTSPESDAPCHVSSGCYAIHCLRKMSENIKQKYLSAFVTKLSLAQEEFKTSSMQVLGHIYVPFHSYF